MWRQLGASSRRNSSDRYSSGVAQHKGDTTKRVTVNLPKSLDELQNRATVLFGKGCGRIRMYHHGVAPIRDLAAFSNVKDGDVVVITLDNRRLTPREVTKLLSTNHADYVEHPLPEKRAPMAKPQGLEPLAFEGRSSYTSDYVKHPYVRRPATVPADIAQYGSTFDATTTYRDQFPWPKPAVRARRCAAPATSIEGLGAPFDSSTSYNTDFVPHPLDARVPVRPSSARRPSQPFEGASTYNSEFTKHPLSRRIMCRPTASRLESGKFQGLTEYTCEYPEKLVPKQILHLEPELDSASRCESA
jgi:hypothetical protein